MHILRLPRLAISMAALSIASLGTAPATGDVAGTITGLTSNAGVVVSLRGPAAAVLPASPKTVDLDQKAMLYVPRVLTIVKGTTVRFLNSDNGPHTTFSPEGKYDLGLMLKGQTREYKFDKPGLYTQLCAMHPAMVAFIVVLDTPHFGVTDESGRFEIRDVPAGQYTMTIWSERAKETTRQLVVESGKHVTADISLSLSR